jgi:hypothetical protein
MMDIELVQEKSLGRVKSGWNLSFKGTRARAIHKWMVMADYLSRIMVAI